MSGYSIKACKELLNKKGERVKVQRCLFNISGYKRYTLLEALRYALSGPKCSKLNIPESKYPELVQWYFKYKNSITGDGVCKFLNMKFFNSSNSDRYNMQECTNRLKEKGWNFESANKMKHSIKKAEKKAAYKATLKK